KRILIIDGDGPARERLRRQFARRGWSVALAGTVTEAMARLDAPHHCILLELTLADGPGETVLRHVPHDNPHPPLILCTGTSGPVRLARAARLGPEAVFGKPVDVEEVVRACEAAEAIPCGRVRFVGASRKLRVSHFSALPDNAVPAYHGRRWREPQM